MLIFNSVSDSIVHRPNLRGLIKCKECNCYNGARATCCKNKKCALSKVHSPRKLKISNGSFPLDVVKLITENDTRLYSVQVDDRDVDHRNFVCITDSLFSSDDNGSIITRYTIW